MSNFDPIIYKKIAVIIIKIMKTKKLALSFVLIASAAITSNAQQLPNSSFEEWKKACDKTTSTSTMSGSDFVRPGIEPNYWNGSSVSSFRVTFELVTKDSQGFPVLTNKELVGQKVPAYMTVGTPWVFVGGKNMFDALNFAAAGDGGSYGGVSFTYRPDAISLRYQKLNTNEKSHVIAYLWSGTFKANVATSVSGKDPNFTYVYGRELEDLDRAVLGKQTENITQKGKLIASVDYELTETTTDWAELVAELNYDETNGNLVPEKMNIILSAADYWTRPNIQGNTQLKVDDVTLLYYSRLSDLKVNGATVAGFDSKKFEYNFLEKVPALSSVSATKMGNAPKIVSTELAANGSDILVTVANQAGANDFDGKNTHTYTLSYMNEKLDGIFTVNAQNPNGSLSIKGQQQGMKLFFKKNDDGKYTVIIPNTSKYGTITVDGVVSEDGKNFGKQTFEVELAGGNATVAIQGIANENDFLYSYSVTLNGETRILTFTNNRALSGVESVEGLSEKVVAKAGSIEVCGVNGNVNVYAVDGRLVKSVAVNGEATIELANGLYIVRTPKTATKVLVK